MRVENSTFKVSDMAGTEPLFRYEFDRAPSEGLPGAHIHLHAHRDAWTFAMCSAGNRTTRSRRLAATVAPPRISDLHFPVGGDRFRPILEDVLQFIVEEFGVDAEDEWKRRLADSREWWRRIQTKACVRDAPGDAAAALRDLGYVVDPPVPEPEGSASILRRC